MADNPLTAIVQLARDAQVKKTREALIMLHNLPKTNETKELLTRLRIADKKIKSQLNFIEKLNRIVQKYA